MCHYLSSKQHFFSSQVLAAGNIFPSTDDNLFNVQTMWLSIKTVLGKNPAIECIHDPVSSNLFMYLDTFIRYLGLEPSRSLHQINKPQNEFLISYY